MGLLAWWRDRRAKQRAALMFEAAWQVTVDGESVAVRDAQGSGGSLAIADIATAVIETNDSGPWGADVWWLLFRSDGMLGVGWPGGATGEQAAIDRLMALPGYDFEQMALAMGSTGNAGFTVWQRSSPTITP